MQLQFRFLYLVQSSFQLRVGLSQDIALFLVDIYKLFLFRVYPWLDMMESNWLLKTNGCRQSGWRFFIHPWDSAS